MGHPTPGQKVVRSAFKKSCDCFNRQLDAGGATPPAIGPRNKSWWHTDSAGSGLRYYNYFMHKTELLYLVDTTPDWCMPFPIDDSCVDDFRPDRNFGGAGTLHVQILRSSGGINRFYRSYLKTPGAENKILHLYSHYGEIGDDCEEQVWRNMGAYSVDPNSWEENTITWNNQPGPGALLDSKIISGIGWKTFDIGNATSVCIKFVDETPFAQNGRDNNFQHVAFYSTESPTLKPYTTET